jgi:hypothetical protein
MYVAVNGMPSASRSAGNVLEVDLFLQVLGAGGDQHAFAAEDRRHEVGERLAGARAASASRTRLLKTRETAPPCDLPERGSKSGIASASGRRGEDHRTGRVGKPASEPADDSGIRVQRELSAQAFLLQREPCRARDRPRESAVRARSSSPIMSISASRMPRVVTAGVPTRMPLATIGGILIERDGVLVDRHPGLVERSFGHLAGDPLREDVHEHQVVVGAAADQRKPAVVRADASRCALATICF